MTFNPMAHRRPDGTFPDMRTRVGERVTGLKDCANGLYCQIFGKIDGKYASFTYSGARWAGGGGDLIGLWEPEAATAPSMADMQAMTDLITSDPAALEAYMAANPLPDEWSRRDQMAWQVYVGLLSMPGAVGSEFAELVKSSFTAVDAFWAVKGERK